MAQGLMSNRQMNGGPSGPHTRGPRDLAARSAALCPVLRLPAPGLHQAGGSSRPALSSGPGGWKVDDDTHLSLPTATDGYCQNQEAGHRRGPGERLHSRLGLSQPRSHSGRDMQPAMPGGCGVPPSLLLPANASNNSKLIWISDSICGARRPRHSCLGQPAGVFPAVQHSLRSLPPD